MPRDEKVDLLKQILENLRRPERLEDHPWAEGVLVRAAVQANPALEAENRGERLAAAISALFKELMPGSPPRKGKRLDTRWGEFGILAAQYFGPMLLGIPAPSSLREAWGGIDQAILLFVYGKRAEDCSAEEAARYKLIGDETGAAPYSTVSDWHLNGLKRFASLLDERSQHLEKAAKNEELSALKAPESAAAQPTKPGRKRLIIGMIALFILLVSIISLVKGWRIYDLAVKVRADLNQAEALTAEKAGLDTALSAKDLLESLHAHTGQLRSEAEPLLRVSGPWLAWLPVYGADLKASADLLVMADELVNSAYIGYQAASPALNALTGGSEAFSPAHLSSLLLEAQPGLIEAQQKLELATAVRAGIAAETLSPKTHALLQKADPLMDLMQDGLTAGIALPALLGASSEGPKTYMLLAQNEDELRPTGGFITLVGSFVIENGNVIGLEFQDSGLFEDWSKPYPSAPWQMQDFMNIPVMLLRDANWFTDYPTTVARVEYLYAYQNKHSVDGVIAMDQQSIVILLNALGPVNMPGIAEAITAENVIAFMRESKIPPPGADLRSWNRKAIITELARVLLKRLTSGEQVDWQKVTVALQKALDQKHILAQIDSPAVKDLLARRGWDGAVRKGTGDFLMSVDSNVGYDKTNALVKEKIAYDVDLSDPEAPKGALVIFHENKARTAALCRPTIPKKDSPEFWYPTDRCYHNYLRIYTPAGTQLLDATPHFIPAEWMPLSKAVPARVDTLDEQIDGLQAFGTLIVVPGSQTVSTAFRYALPPGVITRNGSELTYYLKVQKQPGTLAIPATIRIHLPGAAQIIRLSKGASASGSDILIETTLAADIEITVVFSLR